MSIAVLYLCGSCAGAFDGLEGLWEHLCRAARPGPRSLPGPWITFERDGFTVDHGPPPKVHPGITISVEIVFAEEINLLNSTMTHEGHQ